MDRKDREALKLKVKGGNAATLLKYLDMVQQESLDKLKVCSTETLKHYQSRYSTISEIINLFK